MSAPVLHKLQSFEPCQSRYAVVLDGKTIGTLSKYDDSWVTKFKWKAWKEGKASDDTDYLGEFDSSEEAVKVMVDLTKQQNQTKE